jgi:undecaprenyl-diphosphatase
MDLINAVVLGVIEGLTEFLPISSTGHLIIVNQWFYFSDGFTKIFDIVIQLGAILAIVFLYWSRVNPFGKEEVERRGVFELWKKSIVAVVPALFFGFLFAKVIEQKLFNPEVVAIALILGGVVIIFAERMVPKGAEGSIENISLKQAFTIGLIQCLAMVPGTSRSGATIIGAMLLGVPRKTATEFSFFLAIPTMFAASGYSLLKVGTSFSVHEILILLLGFVVSFLTALYVVKKFVKFIENNSFTNFGFYRIALGIIILFLL